MEEIKLCDGDDIIIPPIHTTNLDEFICPLCHKLNPIKLGILKCECGFDAIIDDHLIIHLSVKFRSDLLDGKIIIKEK